MASRILFCLALSIHAGASVALGEEAKKSDKAEPTAPQISLIYPVVVFAGETNTMFLRGQNLTNITVLHFTNEVPESAIRIVSAKSADVPKDYDVKRIGNQIMELHVFVPALASATVKTNGIIPDGFKGTNIVSVVIVPKENGGDEHEPNGGFGSAAAIHCGQWIRGTIKEPGDVDVFQVRVEAGQRLSSEVYAANGGSMLDSLLTLHDAFGNILAVNDDYAGNRDSRLEWEVVTSGVVKISVQDANDKGGIAHVYALHVNCR